MFLRSLAGVLTLVSLGACGLSRASDAEKSEPAAARTAQAWTLDEAMAQLRLNPEDAYLQYIALQLAWNQRRSGEIAHEIDLLQDQQPWRSRREGRRLDLFDLFTGASAVQESLQLDTMRNEQRAGAYDLTAQDENTVRISDLKGPGVKSHPWGKMLAASQLGGKKPAIGPLDLCVPEDQYFIVFRSLTKLLDGIDAGDVWGAHLFNQAAKCAKTQRASDRLKTQLAIQTDPLTRPFYDMFVDEVAVTGGDLFFREGSDVTMLFHVKQPELFRLRMDGFLEAAAKSRRDAVRSTGQIGSVDYVAVTTPDRAIHVFSAYPTPELHVRGNSKAALERVLAAVAGEKGSHRLGESAEFRYIRTLMPRGAKEEDGLIYLSDPFIRRLVGPELKLTERRRLICYNHLRMIGHAAMLYRTQFGKQPASLAELASSGCASAFAEDGTGRNRGPVALCPCGGKYSLAADGATGVCSHHGNALELVPCSDAPLEKVTRSEAEQYKQFVAEYSQYWRRYFDPIVIRLQVTPKQYRAETIILPLIDNSVYTGMAAIFGGEPETLDALPVPGKNIFSVAVRVNKEELLNHDTPTYGLFRDINRLGLPHGPGTVSAEEFVVMGLGNQIGLHIYDSSPMFDFDLTRFLGELLGEFRSASPGLRDEMLPISFLVASLNSPVYLAIPVRDEKIVDKFLGELDDTLTVLARRKERGGWLDLSYDFYHVTSAETGRHTRCCNVQFGPVKWRLFYERINGGLYIASKRYILDDLAAAAKAAPVVNGSAAHATVTVRPLHWNDVLPEYQLGWAEASREACLNNLGSLGPVARALAASGSNPLTPAEINRAAGKLYGVYSFCPDGGRYEVSPDGRRVRCSLHGTASEPRQPIAPAAGSPMDKVLKDFGGLTAQLTFLEDGLHAVVTIQRKSGQTKRSTAANPSGERAAASGNTVQTGTPNAADHVMIANALARRGHVDEAILHYRKALEIDGNDAAGHNGLALALVRKGQYDEAMAHFRKALQLKPDYAEVYFNLGNYYWARHEDIDKADSARAKAATADAREGEAPLESATDRAIENYQNALRINADYAEAHGSLGLVLAARGRLDQAIEHYEKALQLKPNLAETHNGLGVLLASKGQHKEALVHFRKAIEIKWDYPEAHFNFANSLAACGEWQEAIYNYQNAMALKPDWAEACNGLGAALAKQGKHDEAIQRFRQALKLNPKYAEARKNLEAAESALRDKKK
jgi:tetratricopeptide (TPR) repeat protein